MTEREKLIEAMARASCEAGHHAWPTTDGYNDSAEKRAWRKVAEAALTVIAEQSYAVVPRKAVFPPTARTLDATVFYNGAIAAADLARPTRQQEPSS